ncbi:MAG TPA: zinc-ribbon domain-containing protein, partial [Steroidobacteraceae bacterium]|nr:zinc-ribbon domain-containing protein [Steroidobacteraceae bacterium]
MKAFCTSCGTELGADTRFCIKCGTENPAPAKAKKDRRWLWWVLGLILMFVLGFLLGKMLAPKPPPCPAVAAG